MTRVKWEMRRVPDGSGREELWPVAPEDSVRRVRQGGLFRFGPRPRLTRAKGREVGVGSLLRGGKGTRVERRRKRSFKVREQRLDGRRL